VNFQLLIRGLYCLLGHEAPSCCSRRSSSEKDTYLRGAHGTPHPLLLPRDRCPSLSLVPFFCPFFNCQAMGPCCWADSKLPCPCSRQESIPPLYPHFDRRFFGPPPVGALFPWTVHLVRRVFPPTAPFFFLPLWWARPVFRSWRFPSPPFFCGPVFRQRLRWALSRISRQDLTSVLKLDLPRVTPYNGSSVFFTSKASGARVGGVLDVPNVGVGKFFLHRRCPVFFSIEVFCRTVRQSFFFWNGFSCEGFYPNFFTDVAPRLGSFQLPARPPGTRSDLYPSFHGLCKF